MSGPETIAPAHVEHYDPVASKIGMWLFLFTEVFLFGTLFIVYAVYLSMYRWDFQEGSAHLDKIFGAVNTLILLTSSLTMALSIAALERSKKFLSLALMSATIIFALVFLGVKSVEWHHKIAHDFPQFFKNKEGGICQKGIAVFYLIIFFSQCFQIDMVADI